MRLALIMMAGLVLVGAGLTAPRAHAEPVSVPPLGQSPEQVGDALLSNSIAERNAQADYVTAHPEAVHPIYLAVAAQVLWQRGDRLKAAFWYYVFQARTGPWVKRSDLQFSSLRAALNQSLGSEVNEWIASDPQARTEVASRAIAFEKRAPLYPGRPDGTSEEDWTQAIAAYRLEYEEGFKTYILKTPPEQIHRERKANGLHNGPLQAPGAALPEEWR